MQSLKIKERKVGHNLFSLSHGLISLFNLHASAYSCWGWLTLKCQTTWGTKAWVINN